MATVASDAAAATNTAVDCKGNDAHTRGGVVVVCCCCYCCCCSGSGSGSGISSSSSSGAGVGVVAMMV